MIKKITSLILALTLCFNFSTSVFAMEEPETKSLTISYITITNNDTGESYSIENENIDTQTIYNEDGSINKTISADIVIPNPKTRISATDVGLTGRVNLNITYQQSGDLYKLTRVYGSFELLDSAFTMTNKIVKIGNFDGSDTSKVYEYNVGNSFSYSFNRWVDSSYVPSIVGAYAQCTMSRSGSGSWNIRANEFAVYKDLGISF